MTELNAAACAVLADHGLTAQQWSRIHWNDDHWYGDACGCTDDRCIGHHHDATDPCGCLPALLDQHHKLSGTTTTVDLAALPFADHIAAAAAHHGLDYAELDAEGYVGRFMQTYTVGAHALMSPHMPLDATQLRWMACCMAGISAGLHQAATNHELHGDTT